MMVLRGSDSSFVACAKMASKGISIIEVQRKDGKGEESDRRMVVSGFLWGYLADVRGRKKILIIGYLADGLCNVFSGFSQDFWTLVFFKFLSGFIISGPYATVMAYCSEFHGTKERARVTIMVGFSIAFGCIMNAVLAWLIVPQSWSIVLWDGWFVYNSWRIFLSVCGLPTLIGVVCLCFFPESPKFLMTQGRNEDALQVFRQMYALNTGKPADTYPIQALEDESIVKPTDAEADCATNGKGGFQGGMEQMKAIFYYPYLTRLLLVVTIQFCGLLGMNTLRLWQPQLFAMLDNFDSDKHNMTDRDPTFCEILDLSTMSANVEVPASDAPGCQNTIVSDSVYIDTIIVSLTANFFLLSAGVFVNLLGHKKLLIIGYGVSLLCLVSMNWSTSALLTLVLSCLYVGMTTTTCSVVIAVTVNLFPTSLRTMAVSLEMMTGRIGSMLGNLLFPVLLSWGCLAPIIGLGSFSLMCIVLTCFIPKVKDIQE
ncbi:hypothetical protein KM043_004360 [Ampulex compressa]|nr:hypothetical protein KM043_004360 [Ampulex compressa]